VVVDQPWGRVVGIGESVLAGLTVDRVDERLDASQCGGGRFGLDVSEPLRHATILGLL
jgi:hypothetical protein